MTIKYRETLQYLCCYAAPSRCDEKSTLHIYYVYIERSKLAAPYQWHHIFSKKYHKVCTLYPMNNFKRHKRCTNQVRTCAPLIICLLDLDYDRQ